MESTSHPSPEERLPLGEVLRQERERILERWVGYVLERVPPSHDLSATRRRDHIPDLLDSIAQRLDEGRFPAGLDEVPVGHALERLEEGFDLGQVNTEYRMLRRAIHTVLEERPGPVPTLVELRLLDDALDRAIAVSVERYAAARNRTLEALDRTTRIALSSTSGGVDELLPKLITVLMETTATIDSVAIYLREGDLLRVRAALGVAHEGALGKTVRLGECIAGLTAQRGSPVASSDAAHDPAISSQTVQKEGTRALYAVPMKLADEVIGVAMMGSRTTYAFARTDLLLFQSMVERATAIVVQVELAERERHQRAQAEAALEALAERDAEIQRLFDLTPDLVCVARSDGTYLRVNPAFTELLDYSHQELMRTPFWELVHPDDRQATRAELERLRRPVNKVRFENRSRKKDGSYRWISWNVARDETQDVFVCVGRDVTEERERSEFEQQLIGIVSHDLRNPLNAIALGAATLMRRAHELDEQTLRTAGRMQRASDRAVRLVRDLLDFTRARLGRGIPVQPQAVDLHQVVHQAAEEVHTAHPDRELRFEHLGNGRGEWDPDRLAQVTSNLVSNALRYSPPGTPVTIRTRGHEHHVELQVHNQGTPISANDLARLFQPLQRATDGGDVESVGLGLYIVDQIARAHDGKVSVQTSAAGGTTFTVELPRATAVNPAG